MERASAGMSVIVPERRLEYHLHQFPEAKMFERYTGQARECIFHARFEAARSGSSFIETEHLLLGVFESDRALAGMLFGSPVRLPPFAHRRECRNGLRLKLQAKIWR
jgi:hypothetical protein